MRTSTPEAVAEAYSVPVLTAAQWKLELKEEETFVWPDDESENDDDAYSIYSDEGDEGE